MLSRKSFNALAAACVMSLGFSSATAQTVANGPYYATPSWDQTLACTALNNCPRFIVLSNMGSNAVLDRETGLVWERSPATTIQTWNLARSHCTDRKTGGRMGWRLPSVHELGSLVDPSVPFFTVALPSGHPFTILDSFTYWSATTNAEDTSRAWVMSIFNPSSSHADKGLSRFPVWCVRGGMNADAY